MSKKRKEVDECRVLLKVVREVALALKELSTDSTEKISDLQSKNRRLKARIAELEAENRDLRKQCDLEVVYDNSEARGLTLDSLSLSEKARAAVVRVCGKEMPTLGEIADHTLREFITRKPSSEGVAYEVFAALKHEGLKMQVETNSKDRKRVLRALQREEAKRTPIESLGHLSIGNNNTLRLKGGCDTVWDVLSLSKGKLEQLYGDDKQAFDNVVYALKEAGFSKILKAFERRQR